MNENNVWVVIEYYYNKQIPINQISLESDSESSYKNYGNYELDLETFNYRTEKSNNFFPNLCGFNLINPTNPANPANPANLSNPPNTFRDMRLGNIRLVGIYSSLEKAQEISYQNSNMKILGPGIID